MMNSPTDFIITKENIGLKSYQYILFNNMIKRDQYYEDVAKVKYRLEKSIPNMKQVIHIDMERMKTNKVHERKLKHDLTGPRGLNWQCKQELQRLRSDERDIERDLIRLNRDLAKIVSLPPISQSHQNKELSRSHTPRLSSIAEESSIVSTTEKSKSILRRSSSKNLNRTSINNLIPIQKHLSANKINSHDEHYYWLRKYSFPQVIAKTSDDRSYAQQHAHIINQQKQIIEQKLKQFLH